MKNTILELIGSVPALLQNTHLNIDLQGWPAAVAVIAISISGVKIYALRVSNPITVKESVEQYSTQLSA